MLRENVSPSGHLNTDKFLCALLNYRNTPERDTGLSPAQVIFGHPIRDFLPVQPGRYTPRQEWRMTMKKREQALARRHARQEQLLSEPRLYHHSRYLTWSAFRTSMDPTQ